MPELWIVHESQRERITLLQPQGAVRVVDPSFVSACNPGLIVELRSLRRLLCAHIAQRHPANTSPRRMDMRSCYKAVGCDRNNRSG